MQVSIIIVSWNVRELLERCLTSIFTFTRSMSFEVIVIDNDSQDGTVEMIQGEFPQVRLIANDNNVGFSKANNQGLKIATGGYVYFLNPDTEFIEDSLTELLQVFDRHPKAAAVTGKLVYPDKSLQPNVKGNPGFFDQLLISLKLHHIFKPKSVKNYLKKDFQYGYEQVVEQVMGASLFMKKEILDDLGSWDENFWLWWEDVDLCKRIQDAKYEIIYTPNTKIIHHEGKSFVQQQSLEKQRRFMKGMRLYFKKQKPYWQYIFLILITPPSLLLAFFVQMFQIRPRPQSRV